MSGGLRLRVAAAMCAVIFGAPVAAACASEPVWVPRGPDPITTTGARGYDPPSRYTGRLNAVAVSATDPDTVFVGASEGGVWRTVDGGATWTPIADDMNTLGVSSLRLLDDGTLWIGSGGDQAAGDGLYRIGDAETTPPADIVLEGPFNRRVAGAGSPEGNGVALAGLSVVAIAPDPVDPSTMYVAADDRHFDAYVFPWGATRGERGLYVTTNADADEPVFSRVRVANDNPRVFDATYLPGSSTELMVSTIDSTADSAYDYTQGVYRSADADAPSRDDAVPTFVRTAYMCCSRINLGVSGDTVYVSAGENYGLLFKSVDRGRTFREGTADAEETSSTEFRTNASAWGVGAHTGGIGVDPTDPDNLILGGAYEGRGFHVAIASSDGATSFGIADEPLREGRPFPHADITAIAFAPSNPDVAWMVGDGGVYRTGNARSTPAGASGRSPIIWEDRNAPSLNTVQAYGLDVHPRDPEYTLIGTQDNSGVLTAPDLGPSWRAFSLSGDLFTVQLDDNATDTTDVTIYGSCGRYDSTPDALAGDLHYLGCRRGSVVLGPGRPNPVYLDVGAVSNYDQVFRSADRGATFAPVFTGAASMAVAPHDDAVRLFGRRDGGLYLGSRSIAGGWPKSYLPRELRDFPNAVLQTVVFDPTDPETAYVGLGGFLGRDPDGALRPHVWRTTNLSAPSPDWSPAGEGLPDLAIWSLQVDPDNPGTVFAGTHSGVFRSVDQGRHWQPFGIGLPRGCEPDPAGTCPAKIMLIGQDTMRIVPGASPAPVLRIATHSRGVWDIPLGATCDGKPATIVAQPGEDRVQGTDGDDVILALRGDHRINSGNGDDTICAGAGDDIVRAGNGDDVVYGGGGTDDVKGGDGADRLILLGPGIGDARVDGGNGDDRIITGAGADTVRAGNGNDRVTSGGGNDDVSAGNGDDRIDAGSGDDEVDAGADDDDVALGDGANSAKLGSGDDTVTAGSGDDTIDGGSGVDGCDAGTGRNEVKNCEREVLDWAVDDDPPGRPGDPALFSSRVAGSAQSISSSEIKLPKGAAVVSFVARWRNEDGLDVASVRISNDGGETYSLLACTDSTASAAASASATTRSLMPGFTGDSGGFREQRCDVSPYAGERVRLAFTHYNDTLDRTPVASPSGFWIDEVRVGGREISDGSTLSGWRSVYNR